MLVMQWVTIAITFILMNIFDVTDRKRTVVSTYILVMLILLAAAIAGESMGYLILGSLAHVAGRDYTSALFMQFAVMRILLVVMWVVVIRKFDMLDDGELGELGFKHKYRYCTYIDILMFFVGGVLAWFLFFIPVTCVVIKELRSEED